LQKVDKQENFSKYFSVHYYKNLGATSGKPKWPKLVHFSGHAENMGALTTALELGGKKRHYTSVEPGTAYFFDFFSS